MKGFKKWVAKRLAKWGLIEVYYRTPPILVVAGNYHQAEMRAKELGLTPTEWRYVSRFESIAGYHMPRVLFVGTWATGDSVNDRPWATLDYLAMHKAFIREAPDTNAVPGYVYSGGRG